MMAGRSPWPSPVFPVGTWMGTFSNLQMSVWIGLEGKWRRRVKSKRKRVSLTGSVTRFYSPISKDAQPFWKQLRKTTSDKEYKMLKTHNKNTNSLRVKSKIILMLLRSRFHDFHIDISRSLILL
jgi:hypothetical protein